jgi:hypothetical protein
LYFLNLSLSVIFFFGLLPDNCQSTTGSLPVYYRLSADDWRARCHQLAGIVTLFRRYPPLLPSKTTSPPAL